MPDNPCPHRNITQILEDGKPRQGWTCDACGEHLVTLKMMLNVLRALGQNFFNGIEL